MLKTQIKALSYLFASSLYLFPVEIIKFGIQPRSPFPIQSIANNQLLIGDSLVFSLQTKVISKIDSGNLRVTKIFSFQRETELEHFFYLDESGNLNKYEISSGKRLPIGRFPDTRRASYNPEVNSFIYETEGTVFVSNRITSNESKLYEIEKEENLGHITTFSKYAGTTIVPNDIDLVYFVIFDLKISKPVYKVEKALRFSPQFYGDESRVFLLSHELIPTPNKKSNSKSFAHVIDIEIGKIRRTPLGENILGYFLKNDNLVIVDNSKITIRKTNEIIWD